MKTRESLELGVDTVIQRHRLIEELRFQGIANEAVLAAIEAVPRHQFVDESIAYLAYRNQALPIGKRQTISQPYIVALMTQAIVQTPHVSRVLEIGSGCGYQTAILSEVVDSVYSIERIKSLAVRAQCTISSLEVNNVSIRHGDGFEGWEEAAPFDAIIITAATQDVPETLRGQVRDRGRIVVPIVESGIQDLVALDRVGDKWKRTFLETVVFVPMLSGTSR